MGGRIIQINVKPGQAVKAGDVLLVYEAMKMENDVTAEKDEVVKRIFVKEDEVVGTDAPLIEFADWQRHILMYADAICWKSFK